MERMSVTLSICCAIIGIVSLSQTPETFDLTGLNSPRMFDGASGFGSQMSMWLGPPWRNSRMIDFAAPNPFPLFSTLLAAEAFHWRNSGRFRPMMVAPPTRRSSRRV